MILLEYLDMPNIAEHPKLEKVCGHKLDEIGQDVLRDYQFDLDSRADWEKRNDEGLRLAQQLKDGRTSAGEAIADVKYPAIASAAIQYASRALPAIIKDGEVVRYKTIGSDADSKKASRGKRVAQYMNWQFFEEIENWEEDVDKLLFLQPIVGNFYKKTYPDPVSEKVRSELVTPKDMVVYYLSASFDTAPRKTQILYLTHNEYIENVRSGLYLDIDIKKPDNETDGGMHVFLEQHTTYDLDGDEYEEPYIITIHKDSGKVARIFARYEKRGISESDGQVLSIKPVEYFTDHPFMPSFDGGVYGMGLGILLGPINDSINTLFNQMLDAGTQANSQSGFLGSRLKPLRGGESGKMLFQRNEWKRVQSTGDDLRKQIVPLPVREPSLVLFQLLGFLTQASKELASQSELLSGNQQQHNVPATSTLALIEQGLQVFAGIYKRTYRSLRKEFKKVHRWTALNITNEKYRAVVDDEEADIDDFVRSDYDIVPVSTTATVTGTQKYLKAQALLQVVGRGLDDMAINKFYLEALEIPNVDRFMPKNPPEPPPQFQVEMRKLDIEAKKLDLKAMEVRIKDAEIGAKIREMREKAVKLRADAMKSLAEAEAAEEGDQLAEYEQAMVGLLGQIFELEQIEEKRKAIIRQQENVRQDNSRRMGAPQGQPDLGQN